MSNTVNPEKIKKAPIASSCFMGLGQILFLKQYIRGALFAIVEVVMLCCIIFGTKKIIPANNSEYNYLRSVPDTEEMVEYLEDAEYSKLDKIMKSRAKAMESFFTKKAPKACGKAFYKAAVLEAEELKGDKAEYKDAIAEAKEERDSLVEELSETLGDYVYTYDKDDKIAAYENESDASFEVSDYDEIYELYEGLAAKYDLKLAKVMAKMEAKNYASQLKELKKTVIAEINAEYKTELSEIKSSFALNGSTLEVSSNNNSRKETIKEKKEDRDAKIEEALASIENAFDENYDGCAICKSAAKKGQRSLAHRAWFRGPVVTSLAGLVTLGNKQPTTVTKYMDHSIFMMINGIMALIIIGFFVVLYIFNINGANSAVKKILKNGKFPTMKEAQNDLSQNSFATIGISPAVVMIAIFSIIPLLFSALVAFTNYSSPEHIPPNNLVDWVGLQNFGQMFSLKASAELGGGAWAKTFGWTAIWTLVWAVFATFTCFFVGFFYAFVLQDKRVIIPKFFRTVYILPYAIPTMLSLFVWANLLNGTIGPINRTLQLLGFIDKPIPWLSDPWVAKGSLIFVNIWIGFPYSMILTTSSMTAISNSLYEAAVIDGATKWQQFKSITYPLVMFQLKPTLIMQFAGNINNFGAVFFLTGGGPNMPQAGLTTVTNCGATDLLISWIYKLTMNTPSRYNLASVLSLLVFVVLVPFALYNFTRTKSFKEGEV